MNITHLSYGSGAVSDAINYLLSEKDHNGIVRADVQILAGNAEEFRAICDSIPHKQKYKSVVYAFTAGDNPSDSELQEVLENHEKVAFSGLKKGTFSYLAVLHKESDGSRHLHILSACVHLETGKAYNPAAPGWEKYYGPMRDYLNAKFGWARPDDPRRARVIYGKNLQKTLIWNQRLDPRQQIAETLSVGVVEGKILTRDDVLKELNTIGEVTKESKSSISLLVSGATKPIRLSGPVFSKDWNSDAVKQAFLADRDALNLQREMPDFERAECELLLMKERISIKSEFNKSRGSKKIELQTEEGVQNGPTVRGIIRERIESNRSREATPGRVPGGILRSEFDIERIPAIAGFAGRTGLPVLSLASVGKFGSINSINDVQRLQRSSLDDAGGQVASVLQGDEPDHLEQGGSGGHPGLRRAEHDGQELDDAQRTSEPWRQDDARELAFRAISRANVSSGLVIAAAAGQADVVDQALGRAERAAEPASDATSRADKEIERASDATSDANQSMVSAFRKFAGSLGKLTERVAQQAAQVKAWILARIVTTPVAKIPAVPPPLPAAPVLSAAAVAFAAADAAFSEAKAYERAKAIVRDHRQGRGKAPTPDEIRISQQPAPAKTAFQLAEIRERAANRLDAERGMQDQWRLDTDRD